ncbi:MAG: 30S ribosomal protein S6 [candidate division TM6 bacterium GW2011_GWF2_32_72]|nr:MAG: 30S ribosomal protein S6 [candidate division TM6 bacterium GW2011_GWF2_32_72]
MLRYETLILASPEISTEEIKNMETQVDRIIKKYKGTVISFEKWGKYLLAYPVKKHDYGIYFLVRYELEESNNNQLYKDIDMLFKLKFSDAVLRSMETSLNPNGSLVYLRPKSAEETTVKDVDSFLKENKMEGLLGSDEKKSRFTPKKREVAEVFEEDDFEEIEGAE